MHRAAKEMVARSAFGQEVEKRVELGDPHTAQHIAAARQLFLVLSVVSTRAHPSVVRPPRKTGRLVVHFRLVLPGSGSAPLDQRQRASVKIFGDDIERRSESDRGQNPNGLSRARCHQTNPQQESPKRHFPDGSYAWSGPRYSAASRCGSSWSTAASTLGGAIGKSRSRAPVAAWIALATAAIGGTIGTSPTPRTPKG